ncbi:MAG: hypothetical protein IT320_24500 [Anaerolineae bacterium]|nr:hypothetical protein [Anaerolineae bacterium]
MLDLLATGYPSMDHIVAVSRSPAIGETALLETPIDDTQATFGGCGANVAVALAKLGFRAGVAMVLGDDDVGARYLAYLDGVGVDTCNIARLPGTLSSRSYLFRNPDGEYQNFFLAGAADQWQGELALQGLDEVRYGLVTVGYYPYNRAFVQRLAERDIPIIWQLKPDIAAYPADALADFTRQSKIIFCNQMELEYLSIVLEMSAAEILKAHDLETIVITRGRHGSRVLTAEAQIDIPSVPCEAIDTTGAGDAFTAGFLAGYFKGYPPIDCGRLGAVLAAFCVERVGCQTHLPDWTALQTRYAEHFGDL